VGSGRLAEWTTMNSSTSASTPLPGPQLLDRRRGRGLDRHPIELDRDADLKRALALELMRLDQLDMAFEGKAIKDHDVAARVLLVKVAERRATLLGLNCVS
jgi:hypothetical protein